jgi:hypothetical protein
MYRDERSLESSRREVLILAAKFRRLVELAPTAENGQDMAIVGLLN